MTTAQLVRYDLSKNYFLLCEKYEKYFGINRKYRYISINLFSVVEQEQAIVVSPRVALQPHPYVVHHQSEHLVLAENVQKWQERQEMVTGPPKVHVSNLLNVVEMMEVVNAENQIIVQGMGQVKGAVEQGRIVNQLDFVLKVAG